MKTVTNEYRTWGTSRGTRLPSGLYPPGHPVHVVVGTLHRSPVFSARKAAQAVFPLVENHPRTLAACLMPDHLHWLLDDPEELSGVVGRFKSRASRVLWEAGAAPKGSKVWQRSFWDRVTRSSESLEEMIDYILANPVRAGLVREAGEYPWNVAKWERIDQV